MTTLKRHEIKHCFQSGVWVNELISKFKTKQVFSYKLPEESFDWV
jgi:hypothetical protein